MNSIKVARVETIVFCQEHYNPLGIIRSLGEAGYRPVAIVVRGGRPLSSRSKYLSKAIMVDSVEEGYDKLLEICSETRSRPFVFTSDDTITCFLNDHYDELADKANFFNAGEPGRLRHYMNKETLNELAVRCGLAVLEAVVVDTTERKSPIEYPVITKALDSLEDGWKKYMHICRSDADFAAAMDDFGSKRALVQKYIEKDNEYCIEGLSVDGGKKAMFSIASTYKYILPDSYSPYMDVTNCNEDHICAGLRAMLREIGFEGIYECEFLRDKDGSLYFGEINFRNSTWSYASTCAGMSLPAIWIEAMLDSEVQLEDYLHPVKEGFTAMVEPSDFKNRVLSRKKGLFGWIGDLIQTDCRYYLGKNDFKPVASYLLGR